MKIKKPHGLSGKIMFKNIYSGKKILITGHTGFKGSWLTKWLLDLGADIIGISKNIPTKPSMFEILNLRNKIQHKTVDIRNFKNFFKIIDQEKPDFIFHLAAQSIVSSSYEDPIETLTSNVNGTANLLEALRITNFKCNLVLITSDKSYDNVEQVWGYKEDDRIGGKDPYSGSKGAAELIIKSYYNSYFKLNSNVKIAVARAGNVIGGGDWAKDRVVVDAVNAWSTKKKVEIRNPKSTRPWQHVLEPLSGYLNLGLFLKNKRVQNGEAFNFGPLSEQNRTVKDLLKDLSSYWLFNDFNDAIILDERVSFHEASLLKLNCDKANIFLDWQPALNYEDTIRLTGEWYYNYYNSSEDMNEFTSKQIIKYTEIANKKRIKWTA